MNKLKPTQTMPDKINKNAEQSVKDAVCFLYAHGFITTDECDAIDDRVSKWEKDFYREVNNAT